MIVILGPTASGKTQIATQLAVQIGGEIISADSRQVYRRMDIGTGKDLGEYGDVPNHLIDICEPGTKYNLFLYQQDFRKAYDNIIGRGKMPILCGGTGLYIEAVLKGYQLVPVPENPELRKHLEGKTLQELTEILTDLKQRNCSVMHNTTDVDTCQRAIRAIEIEMGEGNRSRQEVSDSAIQSASVFGIAIDRGLRREKISQRLRTRLDEGMVEEIQGLLNEGISPENLIYYGLEYKYVTLYLTGQMSYDEMVSRLEIAIHQFAKRQMTWFRGMERRGISIKWLPAPQTEEQMQQTIECIMHNY